MKTTWRRLFWWMLLMVCVVAAAAVVFVAFVCDLMHFVAWFNFVNRWLHSANCVATKFRGRFVESASFSSSSSSISSSLLIDELLLLSSAICASLPASANCCCRKKCGSKKCGCKNRVRNFENKLFSQFKWLTRDRFEWMHTELIFRIGLIHSQLI